MLHDALTQILGEHIDPDPAERVKALVKEDLDALGAYDLLLSSYGPSFLSAASM
jgi:hypothetical protein